MMDIEIEFEEFTVEAAQRLVDTLAEFNVYDVEVYEGYSGRGMFGDQVVALTLEGGGSDMLIGYAAAIAGIDPDCLPRRRDSLGLGTVIY